MAATSKPMRKLKKKDPEAFEKKKMKNYDTSFKRPSRASPSNKEKRLKKERKIFQSTKQKIYDATGSYDISKEDYSKAGIKKRKLIEKMAKKV